MGTASSLPLKDGMVSGGDLEKQITEKRRKVDLCAGNQLIETIRTFPGFEWFLLPKPFHELAQVAAKAGSPIIMLNASVDRCDALILAQQHDNVVHVPLPDVSEAKAIELQKALVSLHNGRVPDLDILRAHDIEITEVSPQPILEQTFLRILYLLWEWVAKPVVKVLHLTTDHLTRLWWCSSGIFSLLPLHAAGDYSPNAPLGSKLSDFAIPSYIPSISALLQALDSRPEIPRGTDVLVIAAASGQTLLPGTEEELRLIKKQAGNTIPVKTLIQSEVTIDKVKEGMKTASHVHFACHGIQHADRPTESALLLADSSKLTGRDHRHEAQFQGPDEAAHFAAGMLLAGYRGVIATMWKINDNHAPQVANDVYEVLFRDPESGATKAAEALRFAVKNLRESGAPCSSWVPFIHLGI